MVLTLRYVSEKEDYFKDILNLIKKSKKKVCYVTFNKSCGFLNVALEKEVIDVDKVYFIDCISAEVKKPRKVYNCNFTSAPYELQEIGKSIRNAIKNGYSTVIFDSLSNLLIYGQVIPSGTNILSRFIESFLPDLKKQNGEGLFICKLKDKKGVLIEETLPIFDKIIGG